MTAAEGIPEGFRSDESGRVVPRGEEAMRSGRHCSLRDRDGVRNSFLVLMKAIPGKDSQETVPDTVSPPCRDYLSWSRSVVLLMVAVLSLATIRST